MEKETDRTLSHSSIELVGCSVSHWIGVLSVMPFL